MRRTIFTLTLKGLPALLIIASLSSCFLPGISYRNQEVERFIGRSESELIKYFGTPRAVEYDSEGRKILVFEWTTKETVQEEGRSRTDSSQGSLTILHRVAEQ